MGPRLFRRHRPHSEQGGYINFMAADDDTRVQANYGQTTIDSSPMKRKYDPGNLFQVNQNIKP